MALLMRALVAPGYVFFLEGYALQSVPAGLYAHPAAGRVLSAICLNRSTMGRESPASQASSMWLTAFAPRSGRQTTSAGAIRRTHAGAIETPCPAAINCRIVSQ